MGRHAVVVGAGVGGLCTAIGLGRTGWRVTVLERWPRVTAIGAGIGVWPDAQASLDALGVGNAFRAHAIEFGGSGIFTAGGRRLCDVPTRRVERRGGTPIRILPRTALITVLADAARAVAEVHVGVDVAAASDLLESAQLVVGADGLRSAVRPMSFTAVAAATPTGFVAWRGQVASELAADAYGETWGPDALCGLTRLGPGRTNFYVAVPDDGADFDVVRTRLARWRAPIPDVLGEASVDRLLRNPIEELRPHLPSYVTDRVVLVGDAAHAMTPNLGRGACEAIIDATTLVEAVADTDVARGLRRYDSARRRPTQHVVDRSRRALGVSTATRTAVRDVALRVASPFIR